MNGGYLIHRRLRRSEEQVKRHRSSGIKPETSDKMRYLALMPRRGTPGRPTCRGYYVAQDRDLERSRRRYRKIALNSFTSVLPADDPRYLILIMLDEPQALPETHGFRTSAGTRCRPALHIGRVAPLLGIQPRFDLPPADQLILASSTASR
jgi:cell division protein FtsI (penicillin-binding protein 3)